MTFAILLALVSLYQLSFTYVSWQVSQDAEEYAGGKAAKERAYLDSMMSETVYLGMTYREVKKKELNLGLDLKGGMNVTLEVSVVELIKALALDANDPTLVRTIERAKELQEDSQEDFITLFAQAYNELEPNGKLATIFRGGAMRDKISPNSTNEEVLNVIREEANGAIDRSFNILRTRIDRFGVVQPNIRELGTEGRILVELPGVKNPENVRELLQSTASMEFYRTYKVEEIYPELQKINAKLRKKHEGTEDSLQTDTATTTGEIVPVEEPGEETAEEAETDIEPASDNNEETGLDQLTDEPDALLDGDSLDALLDDTAATAEDTTAVSPEEQQQNNPWYTVVRPPVNEQGGFYPTPVVGYVHRKDISKVEKWIESKEIQKILRSKNIKFAWEAEGKKGSEDFVALIALQEEKRGGPVLEGDVIEDASVDMGQTRAEFQVVMQMNGRGTEEWARITENNVGNEIAIVLDGYVMSYPTVQSKIPYGRSQITGDFSLEEAQMLANILKSGKLPAPANIIEEAIVGPSLGHEAIMSGLLSFIIAFVVVLLYMIFYYAKAGAVANVALVANIFFIFGALASLGAVLTLPGIAGIILTIGMSVDANVLIFDRIREEVHAGKGIRLAVADGYKNALSAIIDANVTTLLTGIILLVFGTGPIRGFATTLVIGILTSLFSAIFITRLVFVWMLDKKINITFATKLTKNAFNNLKIKFLGKRKMAYAVSGLLIAVSLYSLGTRGLNFGTDFVGGRTYTISFDQNVNPTEVQKLLTDKLDGAPEVKTFGTENQVKINTKYLIDSDDNKADSLVEAAIYEGVQPLLGDTVTMQSFLQNHRLSSQKVGPTIADDIKVKAVWALIFSLIIIFLYIFIRFRTWQFGLGALAALVHDVAIILGIFSIAHGYLPFSLEIDQAFIAALLTVIGYSINDTVVVFDRIRELVGLYPKREKRQVYNNALNATISRTFSTSLSTFVVLLSIFIFGGEVIRGFIFALLAGVVVGTYSSLFIATPVAFDTIKKKDALVKTKAPKGKLNQ